MRPSYLDAAALDALIARALAEDVGPGDVTTLATVPPGTPATARFLAKADGVLAGLDVATRVLSAADPALRVVWHRADGDRVVAGTVFGEVAGPARGLLAAERLALNLLQRMSGIATTTRHYVEAAAPYGARILDTRKTAPGLRALDKWAVRLGGGDNHRVGLFDLILIKDNHAAAAGGVAAALAAARRYRDAHAPALAIEVEVRTLEEVDAVLATGGADLLLLDNMARPGGHLDVSLLRAAVERVGGRLPTEASGNVTLGTVAAIAATGVDRISCGALTHSVAALDLSLKIDVG